MQSFCQTTASPLVCSFLPSESSSTTLACQCHDAPDACEFGAPGLTVPELKGLVKGIADGAADGLKSGVDAGKYAVAFSCTQPYSARCLPV